MKLFHYFFALLGAFLLFAMTMAYIYATDQKPAIGFTLVLSVILSAGFAIVKSMLRK